MASGEHVPRMEESMGHGGEESSNEILHCAMYTIGLIITGMNSLVTALATKSTATILLTQNIQTTETVNNLCTSTAKAFTIQNDFNKLSRTALVVIQD